MAEWIPCELHTHSLHSDGSSSVSGLAVSAAGMDIRALALTDHNTVSGWRDIPAAEKESGIVVVPGLEWTTFYGHMVALGVESYVDWRFLGIDSIDRGIASIRAAGGLAGIAHPFRPGAPYCCGCFWQYRVGDWNAVDYLEVWSETDPWARHSNRRAFALWTDLLNRGYRIAGTSGRDWHGDESGGMASLTYLGIRGDPSDWREYRAALAAGRAYCTLGPSLDLAFRVGESRYGIGDSLPPGFGSGVLELIVDMEERARFRRWDCRELELRVEGGGGRAGAIRMPIPDGGGRHTAAIALSEADLGTWFRAELWDRDTLRAFTNPLYLARESTCGTPASVPAPASAPAPRPRSSSPESFHGRFPDDA